MTRSTHDGMRILNNRARDICDAYNIANLKSRGTEYAALVISAATWNEIARKRQEQRAFDRLYHDLEEAYQALLYLGYGPNE